MVESLLVRLQTGTNVGASQVNASQEQKRDYKAWLIDQIMAESFCPVSEAYERATKFIDSPRYEASFTRWRGLNVDILLATNPGEVVKFPNV